MVRSVVYRGNGDARGAGMCGSGLVGGVRVGVNVVVV